MKTPYQPIYKASRGDIIESIHFGAIAVVDREGNLAASYGEPFGTSFLRSTAKPFQALPFIEKKGHEHFGFSKAEIALICASHAGTDAHLDAVQEIQRKVGVEEGSLQCGTHFPFDKFSADKLIRLEQQPHTNHHNCSGKHTGMLAHAQWLNADIKDYLDMDHPVQQSILQSFAEMCELEPSDIQIGIDGCSAPNFAVPFFNAAWALARLADPQDLSEARAEACRTITEAMIAYPEMVSGPERFDTVLMEVLKGKVVCKGGAEGYQGISVMPGAMGKDSPGLGVAIKISDGDNNGRVRPVVSIEVLRQLGVLTDSDLGKLANFGPTKDVLNWRKLIVGEQEPSFQLNRGG